MKTEGYLGLVISDKRVGTLKLLEQGPCDVSRIKHHFGVKTTAEIVPRIKELLHIGLIAGTSGEYRLTDLGRVYLKLFTPFLDLTEILNKSPFFKDHDISPIPNDLLYRLNELKNCNTVRIERSSVFEPGALFMKNVKAASNITGTAHAFFPGWVDLFVEQSNKKIPIEIIITPEIYEKLKNQYPDQLETFLNNGSCIYIHDVNITCTITPQFTCLLLDLKNGIFDHSNILVSNNDPLALKWAQDLFSYYKSNAIKIETNIFASIVINDSPSLIPLENQLSVFS
jgi:predicted transcriptional regulator